MSAASRAIFALSGIAASAVIGFIVVFVDQRYTTALVGFLLAALAGFVAGRVTHGAWIAGIACVAAVAFPRVVQRDFPEPWFTTASGPPLALLTVLVVGVVLARATPDERRVVLAPVALTGLGYCLHPVLLVEPTMVLIASSGALYVSGRRWRPRRGGLLLVAWGMGAASIFFLIPGYQGEIAALESGVRIFGAFGNPLIAADSLILMGAALVALWWRRWALCLAVGTVTGAAVIETGSRTGVLLFGVLVVAMIFGAFPARRDRRAAGPRMLIAILALAGSYAFLTAGAELGRIGGVSAQDDSFRSRITALLEGGSQALSHPFGGAVIDLRTAAGDLTSYENIFFDTAARYGWLPLAALVTALLMIGRRSSRPARVQLFILILAGMTAAVTYFPAVWVVGLVTVGLVHAVDERRDAPPPRKQERGGQVRRRRMVSR